MKKELIIKLIFGIMCVFCVVMLLFGKTGVLASKSNDSSEIKHSYYKITTEDAEWKEFQTGDEMRKAVYLDEEALVDLSTEELLRAVIEYPLICDLYAYDSFDIGIKMVSVNCTALRLFLQRKDAKDIIGESLKDMKSFEIKMQTTDAQKKLAPFVISRLQSYLSGFYVDILEITNVYTPRNTAVEVYRVSEMSSNEISALNDYYMETYPQAQFVAPSTNNYNCHSYAWYMSSTSNQYWMSDPSSYMTDGSYIQVNTIMNAHKVYYLYGDHSANVYDVAGNSIANAKVISKWGAAPLMIHKVHYCPYQGGVTLWKRN